MQFYLAIPCYNEGERLTQFLPGLCTALAKSNISVTVQIIDDGSTFFDQGHYRSLMELLQGTFSFLKEPLTLDLNQGKGAAVYAGWAANDDVDMLAFADADGAVAPTEIVRVLSNIVNDPDADNTFYAASRIKTSETNVNRAALRNIGGLTFRWLRKQLFTFSIEDTQCGFKILPSSFFRENRNRLIESRFIFDIELLHRADQAGLKMKEVPVNWIEVKGGHMTLGNSLGLFKDLLKLRGRLDKELPHPDPTE